MNENGQQEAASFSDGKVNVDNYTRARTILMRARNSLRQAQRLLAKGRPDVTWWSWLYQLQAQLEHEWLIHPFNLGRDNFTDEDFARSVGHLDRYQDAGGEGPSWKAGLTQLSLVALNQGCVSKADVPGRAQSLIHGLRAVRYGMQCARGDLERLKQLHSLEVQYSVWFVWNQMEFGAQKWQSEHLNLWETACKIVGLKSGVDIESAIGSFRPGLASTNGSTNDLRRRILDAEQREIEQTIMKQERVLEKDSLPEEVLDQNPIVIVP